MTIVRWGIGAAVLATIAAAGAAQRFDAGGYRERTGRELYAHVCQGCHMPAGEGAVGAGAYPALANDPRLAARLYPVLVILKGQKAMPSFAELTDAQVAEVTNYVRGSFGNAFADPVTAADVATLRSRAKVGGAFHPG